MAGLPTRSSVLKLLLNNVDQVLHLLWWTSPEDQTVARVGVAILLLRAVQLDKMFIKNPAIEVVGQDLVLLLAVSSDSVELVALLELLLKFVLGLHSQSTTMKAY